MNSESHLLIPLLTVFLSTLTNHLDVLPSNDSQSITISPLLFNCSLQNIHHLQLSKAPKKCMFGHLLYMFSLMLINASDCHPNPGPWTVKYPCGIRGKACVWSRTVRLVACSSCENWFHKDCLNMPTVLYEPLEQTDMSWYCCTCGLPNFNTSLFEDIDASETGCSTPSHISSNNSIDSSSNIGSPRYASSPNQRTSTPLSNKKVRLLVINFQSLLPKRESFWAMLEYCEPDIILASETWLNPTIAEREVLLESYHFVARKDRPNSSHGGVAIIAKHDLEASEIDVQATTEVVAASFTCND